MPESNVIYIEVKKYVLDNTKKLKVSQLYALVKRKYGLIERVNLQCSPKETQVFTNTTRKRKSDWICVEAF